jgi:hypothetical protein
MGGPDPVPAAPKTAAKADLHAMLDAYTARTNAELASLQSYVGFLRECTADLKDHIACLERWPLATDGGAACAFGQPPLWGTGHRPGPDRRDRPARPRRAQGSVRSPGAAPTAAAPAEPPAPVAPRQP